jgi:hypothetical protein
VQNVNKHVQRDNIQRSFIKVLKNSVKVHRRAHSVCHILKLQAAKQSKRKLFKYYYQWKTPTASLISSLLLDEASKCRKEDSQFSSLCARAFQDSGKCLGRFFSEVSKYLVDRYRLESADILIASREANKFYTYLPTNGGYSLGHENMDQLLTESKSSLFERQDLSLGKSFLKSCGDFRTEEGEIKPYIAIKSISQDRRFNAKVDLPFVKERTKLLKEDAEMGQVLVPVFSSSQKLKFILRFHRIA